MKKPRVFTFFVNEFGDETHEVPTDDNESRSKKFVKFKAYKKLKKTAQRRTPWKTILLVVALIVADSYLIGWNIGFDKGYKMGADDTIIAGKVQVECKFKQNPKKHENNKCEAGVDEEQ